MLLVLDSSSALRAASSREAAAQLADHELIGPALLWSEVHSADAIQRKHDRSISIKHDHNDQQIDRDDKRSTTTDHPKGMPMFSMSKDHFLPSLPGPCGS